MTEILDWSHEATDIGERGLKKSRSATSAELAALAQNLDLVSCSHLDVTYTVEGRGRDAYRVTGEVDAGVVQACVITLEPVTDRVRERFTVTFRRDAVTDGPKTARQADTTDPEMEILAAEDVEPLIRDRIEVGRIVYETLSAGLNPYPRKEGADFDWQDPRAEADRIKTHPFAALKSLKKDG